MVPADHLKASLTLVDLLGSRCDFESSAQHDKLSLISRRRKSGIFTNWAKRPIHSVSDGCEATEPQKNLKAELDLLSRCRCPFSLSTSICSRRYLLQSLPSNFVIYVCIVGLHILLVDFTPHRWCFLSLIGCPKSILLPEPTWWWGIFCRLRLRTFPLLKYSALANSCATLL
jgi:hypothetical protein